MPSADKPRDCLSLIENRPTYPQKLAYQARYWRAHGDDDTAERIEAQLHAAGLCVVCGRLLTDPDSVARGIGPDCWRRLHLPEV